MSSDAASDQHATPDGFVQRAELLADLGRYDEAAMELGFAVVLDPAHSRALTTLARVHLAADRPAEALAAADAAARAAPGSVPPLVARGMALTDLQRFGEAAQTANEVLALGPDDAYAQRSGAAILGASRNGQPALNAAWRGVQLAPEDAQAHLVLGLVSARLHLFDLAERAYREALRLNPDLAEARLDMGVIRLEQRRYAEELEHLAEAAAMPQALVETPRSMGDALRLPVRYGAGYTLVAAVLVAFMAADGGAMSRVSAALMAVTGFVLLWIVAARLGDGINSLPGLLRGDRALAVAVCAVLAAPCLILLYALVGTPWPLVLAIVAAAVATFAVLRRTWW